MSKLIEKIVAARIKCHMQNSGILNNLQSAYKSGHFPETAILYIALKFVCGLLHDRS